MPTAAQTDAQPAADWDAVTDHIRGLGRLEADWNGYGAAAVPADMIQWAVECGTKYLRENHPVPHAIYAFPDGHVVFEWYEDAKLVRQIEVEGPGRGQLMSRRPGGEFAFEGITWDAAALNGSGRHQ